MEIFSSHLEYNNLLRFINPYIFHNRFKVSINSFLSNLSFSINRVDVIIS